MFFIFFNNTFSYIIILDILYNLNNRYYEIFLSLFDYQDASIYEFSTLCTFFYVDCTNTIK